MESVAHIAILAFYTEQYDLSDCVVNASDAKKFAKTLKGDKTGRKVSWNLRLESVCLSWFEM